MEDLSRSARYSFAKLLFMVSPYNYAKFKRSRCLKKVYPSPTPQWNCTFRRRMELRASTLGLAVAPPHSGERSQSSSDLRRVWSARCIVVCQCSNYSQKIKLKIQGKLLHALLLSITKWPPIRYSD
nr:PREDICTED: uncharacterized protein LOC105662446 [Megachile rotundata]